MCHAKMCAGSFSVFLSLKNRFFVFAGPPQKHRKFTKTRKVSLKEKKSESLSHSTQTHTHKLKTGKKESAKRRRRDAAAAQTESIYRERVKRGYVAVIQRARVPEK